MTNGLENGAPLKMSIEELKETKSEMMRYRANSLSYGLGFGAIGFSILGSFICLNSLQPSTALVILKILMNIIILLFGFLSCEKAKNYAKEGSISLIVLGTLCALRILWIPLQLLIHFNKFLPAQTWLNTHPSATNEEKAGYQEIVNESSKYLGTTITDYYNGNSGNINWLPADGNFRATLAIALLICAAILFFIAGVVGYFRSNRLNAYINRVNQRN